MEPLAVNDVGPRPHLSYTSSVLKFFYLMVSELFFFTMVQATNGYAHFNNPNYAHWEDVTLEEMKAFVEFYGNTQPPTTFKFLEHSAGTWQSSFQKYDSWVAFLEAYLVFPHQRSRIGIAPRSSKLRQTAESATNSQPSL